MLFTTQKQLWSLQQSYKMNFAKGENEAKEFSFLHSPEFFKLSQHKYGMCEISC